MLIYMTQESKELLLKDLSGRLSYGVKIEIDLNDGYKIIDELVLVQSDYVVLVSGEDYEIPIEWVKPCLFPPQSLPQAQKEEICKAADGMECGSEIEKVAAMVKVIDLMNKYKVDYRDLIPNGLAKDATGLNLYEK